MTNFVIYMTLLRFILVSVLYVAIGIGIGYWLAGRRTRKQMKELRLEADRSFARGCLISARGRMLKSEHAAEQINPDLNPDNPAEQINRDLLGHNAEGV
jgi:hypothetical protein